MPARVLLVMGLLAARPLPAEVVKPPEGFQAMSIFLAGGGLRMGQVIGATNPRGKKIAALAEAHYVPLCPHNPNGPLATAAAVHLLAAIPNC